jgi:subtilase family serine protease
MIANRRPSFSPRFDHLDDRILMSASPLSPTQIRQAYQENFSFTVNGRSTTANGAGQTIAIIVGGLDPYITNDLATVDQAFGFPAPPSFQNLYYQGAQYNESAECIAETSLDVEWAHAVAPGANIMLVQAASGNFSDLMTAVNWARYQPGVSVVSMSFGGPETSSDHQWDSILTTPTGHTGVTFVASSGDYGAWNNPQKTQVGVLWPAADPNVLSVGGTTLSIASNGTYLGESGWYDSGGGYSRVYAEPSYQYGVQGSGLRTVPDVAYDADNNNSPVWIYDSLAGGWAGEGGTSAGAPQWAGLIAEADQGRALVGLTPLDGPSQTLPAIYASSSAFHDITTGSNGYQAGPGYDLVTGMGTPIAYVLAGDLAFHVNSNYSASEFKSLAAVSTSPAASGTRSSPAASPMDVPHVSWAAIPGAINASVNAGPASRSMRQPIVVPQVLRALGRAASIQLAPLDPMRDRHDRAVLSLLEDRFGLLMS